MTAVMLVGGMMVIVIVTTMTDLIVDLVLLCIGVPERFHACTYLTYLSVYMSFAIGTSTNYREHWLAS